MNLIWSILLIITLILMLFVSPDKVLNIFVGAGENALELCFGLTAVYFVWLGLFEILTRLNVIEKLTKLIGPQLYKLFGNINDKARQYIALNLAVNLIGIGGAATPSAINAISQMDEGGKTATKQMAMLFVINATSIQLLPTTVMGMRATMGSVAPSDIVLPTLVATTITTMLGIGLVKLFYRKK